MVHEYWELGQSPFRGSLDPRFFYRGPSQEEALARLHYLVDEHLRLGLLLGEAGIGKSLVLEVFCRQLRCAGSQAASVSLLGIDPREMLWLLLAQLGVNPPAAATTFELWRALADHVEENRYQQLATILLVDDADAASREVLETVWRLAQLDLSGETKLTLVLSANRDRLGRLGTRLLELAELRIDLDGWQQADTAGYLESALAAAGRRGPIFGESAVSLIHQLCEGVPRRVKQLAALALLAGARRQVDQIGVEGVEAAFQELGIVTTLAH